MIECHPRFRPRSHPQTILIFIIANVFWVNQVSAQYLNGSAVLLYFTPDSIIIGADSRRLLEDVVINEFVCKIGCVGNVFFTTAGTVGTLNGAYNLQSTVKKACSMGGTIREIVARLDASISVSLMPVIKNIVSKDSTSFKKKPYLAQVNIFGKESGILKLIARQYGGNVAGDSMIIDSLSLPSKLFPSPNIMQFGVFSPCDNLTKVQGFWSPDPIAAFKRFFDMKIRETTDVGCPIDILVLPKNGHAYWVQKKQECDCVSE